jgi:hypothetical protein
MYTTKLFRTERDSPPRKRWRLAGSPLVGPAVLFCFTIAVFWKILLARQYTWWNGPDLVFQVIPWFQFQASQWHSGHLALCDPRQWAGLDVLGQAQTGAAYPLNWLLFSLPFKQGFISPTYLNWYFAAIHYMAGAVRLLAVP